MNFKRINDLDVLVEGEDREKAIVVLHGYGADFKDLAPLHQYLDPRGQFAWYFLNGPLSVDLGFGMEGRAWFPIDMERLARVQMGEDPMEYFRMRPEGLDEVSAIVSKLVAEIQQNQSIHAIGGFSQGSMVSLASYLLGDFKASRLFLLSSCLIGNTDFGKAEKTLVFQSHGTSDPILPVQGARELRDHLKDWPIEYHEFKGAHEIPLPIIQGLKNFLEEN